MTEGRASKQEVSRQSRSGQHIPDSLDCLAQWSNGEAPTPPKRARAMLDILPNEVWGKVDDVWLDPEVYHELPGTTRARPPLKGVLVLDEEAGGGG